MAVAAETGLTKAAAETGVNMDFTAIQATLAVGECESTWLWRLQRRGAPGARGALSAHRRDIKIAAAEQPKVSAAKGAKGRRERLTQCGTGVPRDAPFCAPAAGSPWACREHREAGEAWWREINRQNEKA